MLELNQTVLYQIIGYFILLLILNRFLYKPVLRILKERDERINGTLKKANEAEKDVSEGLIAYDQKIKEAVTKGNDERSKLRHEGLEEEKLILEKARTKASEELARMKGEIGRTKDSALAKFKDETKSLSKSIAEKMLERNVTLVLLAFVLPLLPGIVRAAEHAAEEEHKSGGLFWSTVNFVIFAVAIFFLWQKVIKGMIEKRGAGIKKALEEADQAKAMAEKKVAEYKDKLALLDKRVAEVYEELKNEGELEKARIREQAEKSAEKIREQAKFAAEQEIKKAKLEISRQVADIAVGMAEEILRKEIKPEDQERLIKGYLEKLRLN